MPETRQGALPRELEACAWFADGARDGALVPLADFTRHRMAKAMRQAAALLDERAPDGVRSRGSWLQTYTGRQFFPMDPDPAEVDIADIAHALSLLCRYNGHVRRFYSVAEHCVLVSRVVPPEHALWGLLHDATEAYVGDMVRPLKNHMPAYRQAEDRVMVAIATRFGISPEMPGEVGAADTRLLLDERAALLGEPPAQWAVEGEPYGVEVEAWSPERAEAEYLARFEELAS